MNIRLEDKGVLRAFLADLSRFRMPKREHQVLARLYQDAGRGQVNTDRFKYALPVLLKWRGVLGEVIDKTFSIQALRHLPFVYKILILPMLYVYLRHLLPMQIQHRRQLKKVDEMLKDVSRKCKNTKVTIGGSK